MNLVHGACGAEQGTACSATPGSEWEVLPQVAHTLYAHSDAGWGHEHWALFHTQRSTVCTEFPQVHTKVSGSTEPSGTQARALRHSIRPSADGEGQRKVRMAGARCVHPPQRWARVAAGSAQAPDPAPTSPAEQLTVVGKISFDPKDVLGRGAGGTFVFR